MNSQELVLQFGEAVVIRHGTLLDTVIHFVTIAFALFLVVRTGGAPPKGTKQS